MSKATLVFNLPEEESEHYDALNGTKYKLALKDVDNILRNKLKYSYLSKDHYNIYQELRDKLYEALDGLDF